MLMCLFDATFSSHIPTHSETSNTSSVSDLVKDIFVLPKPRGDMKESIIKLYA